MSRPIQMHGVLRGVRATEGSREMSRNPILDFGIDRSRLATSAKACNAPSASSPSQTARCGRPMPAAASSASRRTAPATDHAGALRALSAGVVGGEPLSRRHAAQRPRVRPQRRHPDLQLRDRSPGGDVARRTFERARRQHRRETRREGQLRPARFQGSHLGDRVDADQQLDARAPARPRATATSRGTTTATLRIVADGFHFTNEIRFDAKEEFLYVVETTGGRITRLRIDDSGEVQRAGDLRTEQSRHGRVAGRDRVRQLRQPVGHAGLLGQAVRADARRATCASCSTKAIR